MPCQPSGFQLLNSLYVNIKTDICDSVVHGPSPLHEDLCEIYLRNPRYPHVVRRVTRSPGERHLLPTTVETETGFRLASAAYEGPQSREPLLTPRENFTAKSNILRIHCATHIAFFSCLTRPCYDPECKSPSRVAANFVSRQTISTFTLHTHH